MKEYVGHCEYCGEKTYDDYSDMFGNIHYDAEGYCFLRNIKLITEEHHVIEHNAIEDSRVRTISFRDVC